jgi:hypothetical protein
MEERDALLAEKKAQIGTSSEPFIISRANHMVFAEYLQEVFPGCNCRLLIAGWGWNFDQARTHAMRSSTFSRTVPGSFREVARLNGP